MSSRSILLVFLLSIVIPVVTSCTSSRPAAEPVRTDSLIYPPGIDPAMTSNDPTYGYSKDNPIRICLDGSATSDAAAHLYLSRLRNGDFRPLRFQLVKMTGDQGQAIRLYKLTGADSATYSLFIYSNHPDINPLDVLAPAGMYLHK